jgi:hypothetical protein
MHAKQTEDLDQYLLKQLLQDVEETNLPRDEVNLLTICKNDERLYGEKGSDMRRSVQFKFGYMKKWSIHKYVALLDSLGVNPSAVTQAIFRDTAPIDEEEPVPESSDYYEEEDFTSSGIDQQDEGADIADVAARFAGVTMAADSEDNDEDDNLTMGSAAPRFRSPVQKNKPKYRHRTTSKTPERLVRPPREPSRTPDRLFRSPSVVVEAVEVSMVSTCSDETMRSGDGRKEFPYVVDVDPTHPERNHIFDIERSNTVHNAHEHLAYHIRCAIPCPDYDLWEATIPKMLPRKLRGYTKRAMLVKGPSQPSWLRDVKRYHAKLDKQDKSCPETERRHTNTSLEIAKNPERAHSYWLLLWPAGVVLDNQILSNHPTEVEKGIVPMEIDASENEFKKILFGMAIYWRIAEKYGGTQVQDNKTKIDATTLFD